MKSFGQKKSNFMHELKSAILAILQESADWLDWPSPVKAAVKKRLKIFSRLYFHLLFLNMKPLSEIVLIFW